MNYDKVKIILVGGPQDGIELWAADFNVPAVSIQHSDSIRVHVYTPTGQWRDPASMYFSVKEILVFKTQQEYDHFLLTTAPRQTSFEDGASPFGEADCVPA